MLKGNIIYQSDTIFGPIRVLENKKYRWLSFDNSFIQTIIDKKKPYLPELRYLPSLCCLLENNSDKVLLLGTGGGSFLHYIKHHAPEHPIECVDISEEMIHIAQTYFDIQTPIIQANAFEHIKTCKPMSHIFIDFLTNDAIPEPLTQAEFFKDCYQKATKTISVNLITEKKEDADTVLKHIRETFNNKTLCLPVKSRQNMIIHAFKNEKYLDKIYALAEEKRIAPPLWDEHYGIVSEVTYVG